MTNIAMTNTYAVAWLVEHPSASVSFLVSLENHFVPDIATAGPNLTDPPFLSIPPSLSMNINQVLRFSMDNTNTSFARVTRSQYNNYYMKVAPTADTYSKTPMTDSRSTETYKNLEDFGLKY
jgi:hypothetical protein